MATNGMSSPEDDGQLRKQSLDKDLAKLVKVEAATKTVAPAEYRYRKLVRRSHFLTIIAAWVITVPATALLAAVIFYGLNLMQ